MVLRKINWRKLDSKGYNVVGTINYTRVVTIRRIYKNRFDVEIIINLFPVYRQTIDTTDIKVVKREATRLLTDMLVELNDEIKSLTKQK